MSQNQDVQINVNINDQDARRALNDLNVQIEILKSTTERMTGTFATLGLAAVPISNMQRALQDLSGANKEAEQALIRAANALQTQANMSLMAKTKSKKQKAALQKQIAMQNTATASTAKLTKAQIALNIAKKANPIMLIISAAATLISLLPNLVSGIGRWARALLGTQEPTTEAGKSISQLADTWGTSVADIEAEMENYGLTLDEWVERQDSALNEAAERWGVYPQEIMDALGEITLDEWVAQQEEQLDTLAEAWNVSTEYIMEALAEQGISLDEWEAQQKEMLEGLAEEWGMSTDEIVAQMNEQGISASQWAEKMGQAWDSFQADVARNVDSIVNGFRRIPEEYGQSAEDLRQIMEDNIATTEAWRENMGRIASEVSPEMLAWLESKGPEFNSVVAEMLDCETELAEWVATFDRATELGMTQALDNIDDPVIRDAIVSRLGEAGQAAADSTALEDGYRTAIGNANETGVALAREGGIAIGEAAVEGAASVDYSQIPQEITSAIRDGESQVIAAMQSVADGLKDVLDTMKQQADTSSNEMMDNMEQAITGKTDRVQAAVENLRTVIIDTLHPHLPETSRAIVEESLAAMMQAVAGMKADVRASFRTLGDYMMAGLQEAMAEGERQAMIRARAIAEAIRATIAAAFKVKSPSRVMIDLFGNVMDGIYVGMDRGEASVVGKAGDISGNLVQTLTLDPALIERALGKIKAMADSGFMTSRMVLPTSSGFRKTEKAEKSDTIYNNTYNVTITAPKPLSEYEISRNLEDMSRRMQRRLP